MAYFKEANVTAGVNVEVSGSRIKASGPKGMLEKTFIIDKDMKIEKIENRVKVSSESERRNSKALVGTIAAHIRNMIEGVEKGFRNWHTLPYFGTIQAYRSGGAHVTKSKIQGNRERIFLWGVSIS